ncbi:MAG: UbiA family prenyltransferase [Verrucomicrobia bacterium]|nr:UbiA family prenyltransferase [Verrucomicrobiota bacterium]
MTPGNLTAKLRPLLVLGRVSNLPTVWSNCLAGWWLGGGGHVGKFFLLGLGATCVYVGGMYLNDVCDAPFDAMYRRERPIPAGTIAPRTVGWLSAAWLAAGTLLLLALGKATAILCLLLVACVVTYDCVHKFITFSPALMAACRFLLYLAAATTAVEGITGLVVWSSLVLAAYILGLSYLARKESARGVLSAWPAYLLVAPILLALVVNDGDYRSRGLLLSTLLGAWLVHCLRSTFWAATANVPYTVSGLLAGIVLVDFLAAADVPWPLQLVFALLFVAARLFQRFIPAT